MDISPKKVGTPAAKKVLERKGAASKKSFEKELANNANERSGQSGAASSLKRKEAAKSRKPKAKELSQAEQAAKNKEDVKLRHQRSLSLDPLKQVIRKNIEMVRDVPVLAFLNGQLDRLVPAEIPEMVSSNEFIAGALSEGDVGEFLTKEMSVEQILGALNIPDSIIDESVLAGLNLNQVVTPSDMLRSMGVDPSRVQAELTSLRDNMQSKGLSSYMQKSAAMRGMISGQNFANTQDPSKPMASSPTQNISGLSGNAGMAGSVSVPKLPGAGGFGGQQALTQPPKGQSASVMPNQNLASPVSVQPQMQMNQIQAKSVQTNSVQANLNSPELIQPILAAPSKNSSVQPMAKQAEIDPMLAMSQRLNNAQVSKLSIPTNSSNINLEETLMGKQLGGEKIFTDLEEMEFSQVPKLQNIDNSAQDTLSAKLSMNPAVQTTNVKNNFVNQSQDQSNIAAQTYNQIIENKTDQELAKMPAKNANSIVSQKAAALFNQPALSGNSKSVSIDDLQLDLSKFSIEKSDTENNEESSSEQGASDRESGQEFAGLDRGVSSQLLRGLQNSGPSKTDFAAMTQAEAPTAGEGLSPQNRAQMVQKIMDQATALVKNGTGSMNVNLSHMGMGQLEMAVSLNNNKIDLKIITDNDRVSELIGSELASLRDALSVQKMELGNVDVGLEGREEKDSGMTDQQKEQASQFHDQAENKFKENLKDFGFSLENDFESPIVKARPRISQLANPMITRNNGQIEVRV
jgi:hypothetical protein